MKTSVNFEVVKFLETRNGFVFGGLISRHIHEMTKTKEGIIDRRLREMAANGILDKCYSKVDGKGNKVVCYRINPEHTLNRTTAPHSPIPSPVQPRQLSL